MAFAGTPSIKIVSDNLVRVSPGVGPFYLPGANTGTIGLHENTGTPDVRLPAAFRPRRYAGADDQLVSLQDSVQVICVGQPNGGDNVLPPLKTGTSPEDFLITFPASGVDTGDLEIYIRFH